MKKQTRGVSGVQEIIDLGWWIPRLSILFSRLQTGRRWGRDTLAQQCWQDFLYLRSSSSQKLITRNLPPTSPCLLFSAFCSSQMFPERFARLIAAAGPARMFFFFSLYQGRVLATFLFLMASDSFLSVCFVCSVCGISVAF